MRRTLVSSFKIVSFAITLLFAACSGSPDRELAEFREFGTPSLEACGGTTHGIELRGLDDDIADWTIAEATEELGPAQLADVTRDGVRRAGWYDVTVGKANCGMLLTILERKDQSIVMVRGLTSAEIWKVLGGRFPG
jgi:hypothetical protein